ncbi:hypothetical protein DAI18_17815 [Microvirgula aerodenitrificans]|uniref:Phage tail tape measure protein domain-containing protein n=1 Tax=Microvirgula aerodenitrificans TaxID=57480 RepID=A0A2S0PEA4_9NEIS|nr:phage tail tape measure protein [Microvirgula aerodenitrificans]AVY95691.1 hypothetical protein DAI18_17815 [Microvirgula aerodenitrificans]
MSKDIALGILIGGAVSSTLGAAVGKTTGLISGLKAKAEDARGLQALIGRTQQLQREYSETFKSGGKGVDSLRRQIDQHNAALKKAGIDVGALDRSYAKLGRTVKGIQWQTAGIGNMQEGAKLGRTAVTGLGMAAMPTKASGDYQSEIRDIAIKGGIAGQGEEQELDRLVRAAAARQKVNQSELARSVNGLVTQGMDWKEATGYGDLLGELTVGQKMDAGDAAQLIYAFKENGVKQSEMRKVMGEIAVAGDLGAFESDKMAKFLPELMATVGGMGMKGQEAARYLAASLQAQIKLTGNADSAANNLKNLLSKIISPESNKKFADAGIDLQGSMEQTMRAHGDGPIAAFIRLAEHLATKGDKTRAKKIEALKAKVKNSQGDKKAEEEALSAYMQAAGLGEVISDMQARSAALAQIKYADQIQSDLDKIKATDGGAKLAKDKSARDQTSNRKWEMAASEFSGAMISLGDAIRPVTDAAADLAAGALHLGSSLMQDKPWLGLAAVAGGLGTLAWSGKKIVTGGTQWVAGKAMERFGLKLPTDKPGRGGLSIPGVDGKGPGSAAGAQRVFVTNWPGGGISGGDGPDAGGKGKPGARAGRAGRFGRLGSALGRAGGFLGRNAGGILAAGTAAYQVYDTYANARTGKEKGAGYGSAAGSLAGGLAGAKLGAIAGTLAGPIGMAIGGVLGGAIGTFAGSKLGSTVGEKIATAEHKAPAGGPRLGNAIGGRTVVAETIPVAGVRPVPAVVVPPKLVAPARAVPPVAPTTVAATAAGLPASRPASSGAPVSKTQQFVFKPVIQITVKGDVKDPAQVAASLAPYLKRIFDGWQQQAGRSAMFDPVG